MNTSEPALHERLEQVNDEQSFLSFARALAQDRAASVATEARDPSGVNAMASGGWENSSIEGFLESAIAWAEDSRFGASQGLEPKNLWRKFAVFLYCGKIYE